MSNNYLYNKDFGKIEAIGIAKRLLDTNCKELIYQKVEPRPGGYFVQNHQDLILKKENKAKEVIEKKTLRQAVIDNYGKYTVDYEINICPGTKQNIDVLFIHDGFLFIGEMKGPEASGDEPLLKPLLEIETYSRIIDSEKFIDDFTNNLNWVREALSKSQVIKKAIIVYEKKDGKSSPMFRQLFDGKYSETYKILMEKLKIYAIKAESFCKKDGKVEFFTGFSPKDY
ncbi:MAG: hypothetical protein J6W62_04350 [Spirochaetia bacterium]|nr:hypothetical protein [Spirochaetia bacterium]